MGREGTSARAHGAVIRPFGQVLIVEKVGQYEKSENRRLFHHSFPRKHRNYNLRRERVGSDYNYKRRETVVGSHVPIIIAVVELFEPHQLRTLRMILINIGLECILA